LQLAPTHSSPAAQQTESEPHTSVAHASSPPLLDALPVVGAVVVVPVVGAPVVTTPVVESPGPVVASVELAPVVVVVSVTDAVPVSSAQLAVIAAATANARTVKE
jgi:hypothetical protein